MIIKLVDLGLCALALGIPCLLIASHLLAAKKRIYGKLFAIHAALFLSYMSFVVFKSKLILGHDEYGLGQMSLGVVLIASHVLFAFMHILKMHESQNLD